VTPTDLLLVVGLGSLWLVAFAWRLATAPLIAREDPRLHTALEHVHASA
jgi:hypothetical protein